jgi:hypothetical protein
MNSGWEKQQHDRNANSRDGLRREMPKAKPAVVIAEPILRRNHLTLSTTKTRTIGTFF